MKSLLSFQVFITEMWSGLQVHWRYWNDLHMLLVTVWTCVCEICEWLVWLLFCVRSRGWIERGTERNPSGWATLWELTRDKNIYIYDEEKYIYIIGKLCCRRLFDPRQYPYQVMVVRGSQFEEHSQTLEYFRRLLPITLHTHIFLYWNVFNVVFLLLSGSNLIVSNKQL